jgi:hypothetical protein
VGRALVAEEGGLGDEVVLHRKRNVVMVFSAGVLGFHRGVFGGGGGSCLHWLHFGLFVLWCFLFSIHGGESELWQ